MRKTILVLAMASTFVGGSALAAPREGTPRHVAGGWEKLGQREVDGKADHDAIAVGREDGKFKSIQLQVEGSAIEMFDVKVTFENGTSFEPKMRLVFDKNTRSRVIDLPGEKRIIKKVEFRYGNLPGGGKARIELWAKDA